jgi:2-polyprenyl-3-methyl-5-hydroxy-6-metoxy-1,4-benzoquinol methylase
MGYDYDKLYGETAHALGQPNAIFTEFFDTFEKTTARILDVGCGQGRDALFIARRGHHVVGVDLSPNGIRDLQTQADAEGLTIQGIVADITQFKPDGVFDVILCDRTLHMLPQADQLTVLERLLDAVSVDGWVLIADEPSNIPGFETVLATHKNAWQTHKKQRGTLFVKRA